MKVVKADKEGAREAIKVLKKSGVIVYPTDTVYGLGGVFNSTKVAKKIIDIKKRKDEKFILVASSLNQVEKFFKLNKKQKAIVKKYWPGPLSIVVSDKFSIRVPDNDLCRFLAKSVGTPIISTSVNISGKNSLNKVEDVIKEFKNKKNRPDLILDDGEILNSVSSTLIKIEGDSVIVLRQGKLKVIT